MAPTAAAIGKVLEQTIYYHLDNASYDSALFFAERYVAQDDRHLTQPKHGDSVYLHGLCHLRLGDFRSAYDVCKPMRNTSLGCSWVFAQACLALERYKDGIHALERSRGLWSVRNHVGMHDAQHRGGLPDAPSILCLMGKLHRGIDDKPKAIVCFEDAIKLSPFMWDAFKALCDMGVNVRVPNIFKATEATLTDMSQLASHEPETTTSRMPEPKKNPVTRAIPDLGLDPFTANWTSSESSTQPFNIVSTETEVASKYSLPGEFMSKSRNPRTKLTASAPGSDGVETPTGPSPVDNGTRPREPPQPPARRTRAVHSAEPSEEPPPRMISRLGAKKNIRGADKSSDPFADMMSEGGAPAVRPSVPAGERKRTVSGHPVPRPINNDDLTTRRSARLNMFKPSIKANAGVAVPTAGRELKKARPQISRIVRPGSSSSNVGRVVSGNRKPLEDHQMEIDQGEPSRPKEAPTRADSQRAIQSDAMKTTEEAVKWVLDLLKKLGQGYHLLSKFQCQDSLQTWSSLPESHQNTPWVLAQIGRAHFEQASYAEAEKFFRKMRIQAPSRLEDMELYSTTLWHLKREADLSFLAHELVDAAWHSPQAWCALGNAWSLARDPEQALRCFKRATQLDPKFAYAFTLQGHEHVVNEEFEKALTAFRQAISADRRHYNAYYGIGRVQERLGAFDKAYTHYHAAQTINPNNPVLICCIGMALEKQKQIKPALAAYSKAVELSPRTAQTRFKKARALLVIGHHEAAQKELMILKDLAPDEAPVHFLLGTLYRTMDERQLAVRHFTIAMALDPKAGTTIKAAIERFEGDYAPDDSMMM